MPNLKLGVFSAALLAVCQNALAQQPIGAGGQIQQIPQAPALQKPVPDFPTGRSDAVAPSTAAGPKFPVNSLHVTGQTFFSEAELVAATDFKPGSDLSLADLRALASKITEFYNLNGYFVAQAYLPPQDIKDGAVTIAVIEGRYSQISLQNQTNVWDGIFTGVLDGLNSGDPVITDPLERRLLIISDIPGVEVRSTLAPGAAVGTSDLTVGVTPGQRVTGSLEADNWGNPYTGAYRLGGEVNLNEPFGYGDMLSARFLGSTSGGMDYGRLSYQAQVEDATIGVAYTVFYYQLGEHFSDLHASGSEQIASVYGSYPLIRSYNDNLYALLDVDARSFQDKIGATSSTTDKRAYVLIAGPSGDYHDNFGGGGWSTYSLTGTFGNLDIQSPLARAADAATARTDGAYAKLSYSVSRLQHVIGPLSLYAAVRGQFAADNLDISEKMELGGEYGVRAYPEGEAYGDQGYVATLEARLLLPRWVENLPGEMQLIGFVDTGSVTFDKSPWFKGQNDATRSGVGVGLTWADVNDFTATIAYAHELGDAPATSAPDRFGALLGAAREIFLMSARSTHPVRRLRTQGKIIMNGIARSFTNERPSCSALGARVAIWGIAGVIFSLDFGSIAYALPAGGTVVAGAASIAGTKGTVTIDQSSQNAVINWQSFGIGESEAVTFQQPNSRSVALNRVLGPDPSSILGDLSANGKIFLVNPNGILFAPGAQVNVAGLVASTLGITNANFMAGNYKFSGSGTGRILNQGSITADGGYVALLGADVGNDGVISARLGTVALAAGNAVTIDVAGNGLLNVAVDQGAVTALVKNGGMIQANGGQVVMTAKAAGQLLKSAVNNTGVIEAQTVDARNGTIKLLGDDQNGVVNVSGTLDASAPNGGNGGFIETSAAQVNIAKQTKITTVAAKGLTGTWHVDPVDFTVGAGGNIAGTTLSALLVTNSVDISTLAGSDATVAGTPPVTSLHTTTPGNGDINVNDAVSWTAAPSTTTLTLNAGRDVNVNGAVTATNGNFAVCCGRDINVSAAITTTNGSVLLSAGRNVNLNAVGALTTTDGNLTICAAVDINEAAAITLTRGTSIPAQSLGLITGLVLIAGNGGTGPGVAGGTLTFAPLTPPVTVTGPNAPVVIDYNSPSYTAPTDYSANFTLTGGATLTEYMLVFPEGDKVFDGTDVATLVGLKSTAVTRVPHWRHSGCRFRQYRRFR